MERDPATERVAQSLAWQERIPAFLPRLDQLTDDDKRRWWRAIGEQKRDLYRFRAEVAIEAYHTPQAFEVADEAVCAAVAGEKMGEIA